MTATPAFACYRERIAAALAGGAHFAGLHATSDGAFVRTLLAGDDGALWLETVATEEGHAPSIVDLVPASGWDEREAHDLQGIRFAGHEPLRPLVDHDPRLEHWTVPIRGDDAYQVAVGPVHAGIIESGHFRFHVVGDRILHLDARLFYKHRGLEHAAEGASLTDGLAYASRVCAGCNVTNGVAYAHACEEALGLVPTAELSRVRTILLELERMWNHLNDISAICAGVSLAAGTSSFAALAERARRLNADLTGHRFLFGSVRVGGSDLTLDEDAVRAARDEIRRLRTESSRSWRELLFNASFQDRLPDIGIVTEAAAERLGAVGPAARAAGVSRDVRATSPRLAYGSFEVAVPHRRPMGDVQARLEQRALELLQTYAILEQLLDRPVRVASAEGGEGEQPIGIGRVESPRGATSCIVERAGDRVARLRFRTGSYANWPVLAHSAVDNLLPDFPLINKSFELCYACVDR
ncbi:MAG: NADH-quinone oxidoreductase subunit C [Actinomycetota bacterium]